MLIFHFLNCTHALNIIVSIHSSAQAIFFALASSYSLRTLFLYILEQFVQAQEKNDVISILSISLVSTILDAYEENFLLYRTRFNRSFETIKKYCQSTTFCQSHVLEDFLKNFMSVHDEKMLNIKFRCFIKN